MSQGPPRLGKAKKRRAPIDRDTSEIEQTRASTGIYMEQKKATSSPDGMRHLIEEFSEHYSTMRASWLDGIEKGMTLASESNDLFKGQRDDAEAALRRIRTIRHAVARQDIETSMFESYRLGLAIERFSVRAWEYPATAGLDELRLCPFRGHWVKMTPMEAGILAFVDGRTEAPVRKLFAHLYEEPMTDATRGKFDQILTRLNRRLEHLRIQFHVRGENLVRDEQR